MNLTYVWCKICHVKKNIKKGTKKKKRVILCNEKDGHSQTNEKSKDQFRRTLYLAFHIFKNHFSIKKMLNFFFDFAFFHLRICSRYRNSGM